MLAARLPLIERELLRAGRSLQTYFSRMFLTLAALVVMVLVWWASEYGEMNLPSDRIEIVGGFFAWLALGFQYLVIAFIAPSFSASLMIYEKEEDALPLLLVTGRSYADIVGAKYIAVLVQTSSLILCILPIQAIAALFGGIDVGGLALQTLLMILAVAAVCAVGIYFSTVARTTTAAISLTQFILVAWFFGTLFFDRVLRYAGYAFEANLFVAIPGLAFHPVITPQHIPAIALAAIIALWALLRAVYMLPRQVMRAPTAKSSLRAEWNRSNPRQGIHRLVTAGADGLGMRDHSNTVRALAFIGLCLLAQLPILGWLIVVLVYLRTTARGLARLRANGALDELILTPQEDYQLVMAMFRAAFASAAFFVVPLLLGFTGIPRIPSQGFTILYAASEWGAVWAAAFGVIQLALCASVACFAITVSGSVRAKERVANLIYLGGVIVPFLLPYLALAMFAMFARRYDVEPTGEFMMGRFMPFWYSAVSTVVGVFMYVLAIKRIRVKTAIGPPPARGNPLLAVLRP